MAQLPPDLVDLPARTGARRVALHFLAEAADAFPRLDRADDPEALHDFRVGLRRLRSALRSYDPYLGGSLSPKLRRKLRRVARATGASRDVEVHAAWLDEQRASLAPDEQAGAAYFAARLADDREAGEAELAEEVIARFPKLRRKLARALRRYRTTVDVERPDATPTFATASAALLERLAAELVAHLTLVRGIEDEAEAHEARIVGKRLRYALEPLADVVAGVPAVVKQLKRMQDALGDLHDAQLFGAQVRALSDEAGDRPDAALVCPGLDALATRLRERRDVSFVSAHRWIAGDDGAGLVAAARAVAAELDGRAAAGLEVERKYLLRALHDEARAVPPREIEQGYLPGERFVERVRRVRADGEERYVRTVKAGAGARRIEVEESTTRELFDALWSLTEGRRVRKRRHLVPDGGLVWEIDDFADRDLVLAEVELPADADDGAVEITGWLAPYVVRDVTDDAEYVNAQLAR